MANLKVIFDASISAVLAAIDKLLAKNDEAKKKMAEPVPAKDDRRAALEEVKTAKIATEAAKREKAETQAAIKVQAAHVKEAEAAVKAAQDKGVSIDRATAGLERQRKELERLKELGGIRGRAVDVATGNEHQARQAARNVPAITPAVNPAPAMSAFSRIFAAGRSAAAGIEARYLAMRSRLSSLFSGLSGLFAGALAFTGFSLGIGAIKSVITDLDNLGKSARNLNLSAEELQKFQHAANSVNFPTQQLEPAFNKMRKLVGDAVSGIPDAKKKLDLLGVSLDDLKGKTTSQQFDEFAAAINGIADPTERATAAARIFGEEQGPRMLNFLREYKVAAADLETRGVISNEQVQAAEDFNQACTNVAVSLRSWAVNSGFISQLKEIAEGLAAIAVEKNKLEQAAAKGTYTRETGTDYAIDQAKKSGKYTPKQIAKMEAGAAEYKDAHSTSIMSRESFGLIDQALKDSGLGTLARTGNNPFTDNWAGASEVATPKQTPEARQKEVNEARQKREEEQKKAAEREARRKAATEMAKTDFNEKIDSQVAGLENKASGKSDDSGERRRAAIEAETAKAEQAAKAAGMTLTDEQRGRVEKAAGQVFDAEESKNAGKAGESIDEQIAELEKKYELQKMIDAEKVREAAIQEEINRAEKTARSAGRELTDDERGRITEAAGKNFDQAVANETSYVQGPQNRVLSDSLLRIGGVIGGAEGAAKTDYAKQQLDKLTGVSTQLADMQMKVESLLNRTPGRLEAVASGDWEF